MGRTRDNTSMTHLHGMKQTLLTGLKTGELRHDMNVDELVGFIDDVIKNRMKPFESKMNDILNNNEENQFDKEYASRWIGERK